MNVCLQVKYPYSRLKWWLSQLKLALNEEKIVLLVFGCFCGYQREKKRKFQKLTVTFYRGQLV